MSELLTCLLEASDVFSHQQSIDLKDEEERAAREMIKVEQDRAYQASLAMDRYANDLPQSVFKMYSLNKSLLIFIFFKFQS